MIEPSGNNPIKSPYPRPMLSDNGSFLPVKPRLAWDLSLILIGAVTGALSFASTYDQLTGPAKNLYGLAFLFGVVLMALCQRSRHGLLWQTVTMFSSGALLAWTFYAAHIFSRKPIDPDARLLGLYVGLSVLYLVAGGIGMLLKIRPTGIPDWYEAVRYSLSVCFIGPILAVLPGVLLGSLLTALSPVLFPFVAVIVPGCFAVHGYFCFLQKPDKLSARVYVATPIFALLIVTIAGLGVSAPFPFLLAAFAALGLYAFVMEILIRKMQENPPGEIYD